MRLNKFLAECGVASRRGADKLIESGRVSVNGQVVSELGAQVPEKAHVFLDGRLVMPAAEKRLLAWYKPRGFVSTSHDELGRSVFTDLIKKDLSIPTKLRTIVENERLVLVGRLDKESEGLILLTNDGDLALRLTHPRYEKEKEYEVSIDGEVTEAELDRLRQGILLDGEKSNPCRIEVLRRMPGTTMFSVILTEGKKHQIRRMFEFVGHQVTRLCRVRMGSIELQDLKPNQLRLIDLDQA